jgi:predicted CXXCH cytochrome family protein
MERTKQLWRLTPIVCVIVSIIYACATFRKPGDDVIPADNSRCFLCHLDFDGEPLVATHAAHGIGCATCHGPSEAHMADEDHRTPPDKMFDRADVNKACTVCHAAHTSSEVAKLIDGGVNVCTDCHGRHRIAGRGADPLWQ